MKKKTLQIPIKAECYSYELQRATRPNQNCISGKIHNLRGGKKTSSSSNRGFK